VKDTTAPVTLTTMALPLTPSPCAGDLLFLSGPRRSVCLLSAVDAISPALSHCKMWHRGISHSKIRLQIPPNRADPFSLSPITAVPSGRAADPPSPPFGDALRHPRAAQAPGPPLRLTVPAPHTLFMLQRPPFSVS